MADPFTAHKYSKFIQCTRSCPHCHPDIGSEDEKKDAEQREEEEEKEE